VLFKDLFAKAGSQDYMVFIRKTVRKYEVRATMITAKSAPFMENVE
jgi:hypothetical protein